MRPTPRPKLDARLIPLTQGYVAIVDSKHYEWLSQWPWHAHVKASQVFARYEQWVRGDRFYVTMHQLIMGDVPEGQVILHRNGIGTDNRECNLIVGSPALERIWRGSRPSGTYSQFRGVRMVYKSKVDGSLHWRPVVRIRARNVYLPVCHDEIEAAMAWDREMVRYYGPDAYVNFPDKMPEYLQYAKRNPPQDASHTRRSKRDKIDGHGGRRA